MHFLRHASKESAVRELDASYRGRSLGSGIRAITLGEVVDDSEVRTNPEIDLEGFEAPAPGPGGWRGKDWLYVWMIVLATVGLLYYLLKKGVIRI